MPRFRAAATGDACLDASRGRIETTRAAAFAILLALVAASCGRAAEEEAQPSLPPPLAEALAARADTVADHLAAGDPCAAAAEADELVQVTVSAVQAGEVPPELQEELLAGAQELAGRIECPPEAPAPADEEDAPAAEEPADRVQTLVAGDAGEIDFRVRGDALELVEVRPAPGWRHAVSADEDEIDVAFSRGNREVEIAIDADGDGGLKLDVDYEAGRAPAPQTIRLGDAGEIAFEVDGGSLRLLHVSLGPGWEAGVQEDDDKIELEARHEDGSELALTIEPDD